MWADLIQRDDRRVGGQAGNQFRLVECDFDTSKFGESTRRSELMVVAVFAEAACRCITSRGLPNRIAERTVPMPACDTTKSVPQNRRSNVGAATNSAHAMFFGR